MTDGTQAADVVHDQFTTEKPWVARTSEGFGSLYKRGSVWWVKFYRNGKPVRESTGSADRTYAEDYRRIRLSNEGITQEHIRQRLDQSVLALRELAASSQCTIGAISELLVSVDLMNRGFSVFRAMSHNSPCDLVAIGGRHTLRIEVKTVGDKGRPSGLDPLKFDHLAMVVRGAQIKYDPVLPDLTASDAPVLPDLTRPGAPAQEEQ